MIVYTKDDMVKLSGALTKNQWPTIKAAARYLMREHPTGILIDGGELTTVTPEGARTFLDALRDIEAMGARMVVCNLPESARDVIRRIPGLRSQLAFSMSVEEARQSLRSADACSVALPVHAIVVPVFEDADIATAVQLAAVMYRERNRPVGFLGLLVVSRELPLSSPLRDDEARVQHYLSMASELARKHSLPCAAHIERVRDVKDGLLHALAESEAASVVLALRQDRADQEGYLDLSDLLLRKAPCEVLIARVAPTPVKGEATSSEPRTVGASGGGRA